MSQRNTTYHIFSIVRILLYPLSLIYGAVVWLRNRLYDSGVFGGIRFSVPVIAVGNLSVGGTGKTPHVEYLIRLMQYQYRVATMSRGYKRRTQGFLLADVQTNALRIGDEPMQYYMKYPDIVVSVAEERMTGIPTLLQKRPDVEVVLLDDAYQHRSVVPGVNILITDYNKPFYKDHILPVGTLREWRNAYKRADVIIVSKCPPDMTEQTAAEMKRRINPLPKQQVFFTSINYAQPYDMFSQQEVSLQGKSALIVCGIARPEPMVQYVKQQANDVHVLTYHDHHYFLSKDLEEIKAAYNNWEAPNKIILTTEKDAARLHLHADKLREWGITIAVLPIAIGFLFNGESAFNGIVLKYVSDEIAENTTMYGTKEEEDQQDY